MDLSAVYEKQSRYKGDLIDVIFLWASFNSWETAQCILISAQLCAAVANNYPQIKS